MTERVIITHRFHGPPCSGNGGYSCGRVAEFIDGPAAVRLSIPPPLDVPLDVRIEDQKVALFDGDVLVASGRPSKVEIEVPEPPDFAAASAASARYRGFTTHFYPGCFVCGTDREPGDGLRIFAGPVGEGVSPPGMVAASWIPDGSLSDGQGGLAPVFYWSALDCPGAYSFPEPDEGTILLGELAVSILHPVAIGERCVLIGWEISHQGRKHLTGTALFGESGRCCGIGLATWFDVPPAVDG